MPKPKGGGYGTDPKLGGFTINEAKTLAYVDITSILPSETDFFGNVTISSFGITLDQDGENTTMPTINSIEFVSADILDVATSVTPADATSSSLEAGDGDFKKTLTFISGKISNDLGIEFNLDQQLNSSNMFLVIESDNQSLNTSSRIKLRNITVGGVNYENNTGGCYVAGKEVSTGHYLYIHSFYKGSNTSGNLMAQWETNQNMNLTKGTLYINNENMNGTTIKIYRLGFYNLSEIMNMYNLANEKWWYTMTNEGKLDVEIHGNATENQIRINGNYGTANTNTTAYAAQMIRSMGSLPSNFTTINLSGKFSFKTDEQPCAVDVFKDLPSSITEIALDATGVTYLPTVNDKVYLSSQKYFAFKEGSTTIPSQLGTSGGNWSSLTCTFNAGYNTFCAPFNKLQVTSLPTGLTVYKLSSYSEGVVTFEKVSEDVTANDKSWPYIIHAENAGTYALLGRDPETTELPSYSYKSAGDAKLVGSYVNTAPTGDYASKSNFAITSSGIQKMGAEETTDYYRAFLSLPAGYDVQGNGNFTVDGDNITVSVAQAYAITVPDAVAGNSIAADKTTAVAGTTITLTPTLATGYQLTELKYNENDIDLSEESYTFEMPAAAVTITAKYGKEETQGSGNEEVQETISIVDASNAEVTKVEVNQEAATVTIPASIDGIPVTSIAEDAFTDVDFSSVQSVNLKNTKVDLSGDVRSSGVLSAIPENVLIVLPKESSSATGTNVVTTSDGTNFTCSEVKIAEAKAFVNGVTNFTTTKFTFDRTFLTGSGQLNTIFLPVDIPATVAATLGTFYTCNSVTGGAAQLTTVTGDLSANTPYIFAPSNTTLTVDGTTNLTIKVNNAVSNDATAGLKGTYVEGTIGTLATSTNTAYGYAAENTDGATIGEFYKLKSTATVPAYRAWLEITGEAPSRLAIIIDGDGTTGIQSIDGIPVNEGIWYDLKGRRYTSKPSQKGVYILNGKKIIVK